MAEPIRKTAEIIEGLFPAIDPGAPNAALLQASIETEKKVLRRHSGALVKQGRQLERAEIESRLGGYTLEQIIQRPINREAHEAEINRIQAEQTKWLKKAEAHGRNFGLFWGSLLCSILAACATYTVVSITRMDTIAALRAANAPRGLQTGEWTDPTPPPYAHTPHEPGTAP